MLESLGELIAMFFDLCLCGLLETSWKPDDDGDWKPLSDLAKRDRSEW